MTPTEFLTQNKACETGRDYAVGFKTMAEVWDNCPRGDWLLWILKKLRITPERELRLFACWCAEQAQPTDPRSLTAIAVSRRYAIRKATLSELQATSADAARAAYAAAYAYAARAAYAAAAEAAAADAAAAAAVADAARAAAAAARQAQASHFRTLVKNPFL